MALTRICPQPNISDVGRAVGIVHVSQSRGVVVPSEPTEVAVSRKVLGDERFQDILHRWVADGLPRQWLIDECRRLASLMLAEASDVSRAGPTREQHTADATSVQKRREARPDGALRGPTPFAATG